ncbi:MAG: Smr/MutS family protein [Fusobacterium sp.]|nr:Smr/MutS family protein [Fusobacterium sp.]
MFNEIDLHSLDSKIAINLFKKKYNEALKRKDFREILIIHGYGANKLDHKPIIANNIRTFLSKNKDKLKYRLSTNPGITYVTPILKLD